MTLTLEEVRRVRFRMARRGATGYDVADVDNFIDKVEESFAQYENERDLLRREAEAAGQSTGEGDEGAVAARDEEIAALRAELEAARQGGAPGQDAGLQEENDRLRAELERVRGELNDARNQRVSEVASNAETLTVTTSADASPAVVRLVQIHTEQAERLVAEAEDEASRKLSEAERAAHEITTDARTKAERIESEARVNAEQMTRSAQENADSVNSQADERRHQLFAALEREQGQLQEKVAALREFEARFRDNLKGFVTRHLDELETDQPEPADVPELAESQSATPRLDALAQGDEH